MADQSSMNEIGPSSWGPKKEVMEISSLQEFQNIQQTIQDAILKTCRLHAYNTLDTFVEFHNSFREQTSWQSLEEFNDALPVKYEDRSLSCVGLSLKLIEYLGQVDANFKKHLCVVCGDEYPLDVPEPKGNNSPSSQEAAIKGHALVTLEFCLSGRKGFFVIDIGLALDIPVVVMRDGLPPHTGLFERLSRVGYREYRMDMTDPTSSYLLWSIRERSDSGKDCQRKRFLYLGRPYSNPDQLERRNRVYTYHAYMLMGVGGIKAAMYFVLGKDGQRFTVFVPDDAGAMTSATFPYNFFLSPPKEPVSADNEENNWNVLKTFSRMCGFGETEDFVSKMRPLSVTCMDSDFLDQVTKLNDAYTFRLHKAMS